MNGNVDADMVLRFGLKCLGIFAIIFILALLTPWMAKHVDAWIAKYRASHAPEQKERYSVRSIYELPPEPEQEKTDAPHEHAKKKTVVSVRKKTDKS